MHRETVLHRSLTAAACLLALAGPAASDAGKAGFLTHYRGITSPYGVNPVFLLPGETLEIAAEGASPNLELRDGAGRRHRMGTERWAWQAPDSAGFRRLCLSAPGSADSVVFHVFVMVPASDLKGEYLQGYRIGAYPRGPKREYPVYQPPEGFIRLDSSLAELPLSPHFRLGQFRCKQSQAFPAFLVLKEELILRLESVLESVNASGYRCSTFTVMSGFRTPYYNRLIGNVKYSAHQFGAAADIFIDPAGAGQMADLNGDGRRDKRDSEILFKLVDEGSCGDAGQPCGGLGLYDRAASHGPFVHVDVRGFKARW